MSGLTLKATVTCNFRCPGCYENSIPTLWGGKPSYDMDKIKEGLEAWIAEWKRRWPDHEPEVAFHGGEPLNMRIEDMEELMRLIRARGAKISMQTNGYQITERHILAFKAWDVGVGVSLDGPWPLGRSRLLVANPERDPKKDEINRKAILKVQDNIEKMRKYEVRTSIIITMTKLNCGTPQARQALKEWIRWLQSIGVDSGRMNPLYDDDPAIKDEFELTYDQYVEAYNDLMDFVLSDPKLEWLSFREMVDNLLGLGVQPCWFASCDVYNTSAVQAMFGDGTPGNCLRTSQDGVPYVRDTSHMSDVRQQVLWETPQEAGGCAGCPFFRVCHGGCPAEAIDGDWRNRSRFCPKPLYEYLSKKIHGMFPTVKTVEEWTTNDEAWMLRRRQTRSADINAFMCMDPNWSVHGSSWKWQSTQKRGTYGEQRGWQ